MATFLLAQVTIPHVSGIPRDAAVNRWAFRGVDGETRDDVADAAEAGLDAFYGDLTDYFSSRMKTSLAGIEWIDLADDKPRLPFATHAMGLADPSTTEHDLPAEVALCISFQATPVSGVNMRRRRGRIYLGPLQAGASLDYSAVPSAWPAAFVNAATDAFLVPGISPATWSVYSRSTHYGKVVGDPIVEGDEEVPDALPEAFKSVTQVWCDNAWDTQRRRGIAPTTRSTFSL